MTLVLRLVRGAARFEWSDEDAETVVTVESADTDETIVRKLKRIITLLEGEPEPRSAFLAGWTASPPVHTAPPVTGNGWAAPPELPEDRQGQWELIPEEERE